MEQRGKRTMKKLEWKKYKKKPNIVEIREVDQYEHYVRIGDTLRQCICGKHYIMRGEDGELSPIDKKIFHETYELVDEDESSRISEILQKIEELEKEVGSRGRKIQDLVDIIVDRPEVGLKARRDKINQAKSEKRGNE